MGCAHERNQITLMDWGNAIVRSKTTDGSGTINSLTMELHLEGDFKKTAKKITWLAQPTTTHPLVDATLIDYDYIITKKKLEENDELKDFVTPVTEFRQDALADANVRELKRGDIIQFERRGYYVLDRVAEKASAAVLGKQGTTWEFIRIPDGRAAGLASKAGATPANAEGPERSKVMSLPLREVPKVNDGKREAAGAGAGIVNRYGVTSADTKMYKVDMVVGTEAPDVTNATRMYSVESVYRV